jgi:phosphoribosylaminoimidazole-succinocarboxamide synthase
MRHDPPPFMDIELPLPDRREGKVRVSYGLPGHRRLFVTTDRLSAFDRVIAGVPYKGQVLNQLAAWWFRTTADVVANHLVGTPDPNVTVGVAAVPLPVEVVVRAYITGVTSTSLWTRYAAGRRTIDGYTFPDGLRRDTALPRPIVTPTTKGAHGAHDEPISCAEVVDRDLVPAPLWDRVHDVALALFSRGQERAAAAGLILADTKYEFGLGPDGDLLLIDEVHTPDSSRLWLAATYEERLAAGREPESLDKEPVRRALQESGYRGEGPLPELDPEVWRRTTDRYIAAYESLTGARFDAGSYPVDARIRANLSVEGVL